MERQGRLRRIIEHGDLPGLDDNDHPQYVNAISDTSSIDLTLIGQSISGVAVPGGIDHDSLLNVHQDVNTDASPIWVGATLSGLTATRVLFAGASGVISDDAGLTYASATNILTASTFNATDEDNALQIDGTTFFRTGTAANLNIFLGEGTFDNADGSTNVGIGYHAGFNNTGSSSIYIGKEAGAGLTGGTDNSGIFNVVIGALALKSNTGGDENFALGFSSLLENTSGSRNVAIGYFSLAANTTSNDNIAIGSKSMWKSTGRSNVGIGEQALQAQTSGEDNIGIGKLVGQYQTTGDRNTLIGRSAGAGTSGQSIYSENTFIGYASGFRITTGSTNCFIGYISGVQQTTNSNLLIIDNQDRGSAAAELTDCLIYGIFNSTVTSQSIRFNVGDLTLASGTPYQTLWNTTHEDSDGGRESRLNFKGEQSGGEVTTLARIEISHDGVADDEKGKIERYINIGSDGDSPTLAETIDSSLDVFWTKAKITAIGGYAIKLTNNTGSNSVEGQLVEADDTDENSYKVADANALDVIGVVYNAGVADGSEVWIVQGGIAEVLLDAGGCVHHDRLISSATAGSADVSNAPAVAVHFQEIGHAIETVVGAGLAKAVLHFL